MMQVTKEEFSRLKRPPVGGLLGLTTEERERIIEKWENKEPLAALNVFVEQHVSPERVINIQCIPDESRERYLLFYWKWVPKE